MLSSLVSTFKSSRLLLFLLCKTHPSFLPHLGPYTKLNLFTGPFEASSYRFSIIRLLAVCHFTMRILVTWEKNYTVEEVKMPKFFHRLHGLQSTFSLRHFFQTYVDRYVPVPLWIWDGWFDSCWKIGLSIVSRTFFLFLSLTSLVLYYFYCHEVQKPPHPLPFYIFQHCSRLLYTSFPFRRIHSLPLGCCWKRMQRLTS